MTGDMYTTSDPTCSPTTSWVVVDANDACTSVGLPTDVQLFMHDVEDEGQPRVPGWCSEFGRLLALPPVAPKEFVPVRERYVITAPYRHFFHVR